MTTYKDAGHRPHADWSGDEPSFVVTEGPNSLSVTLDQWGPTDPFETMYRYLQSNWGEFPVSHDEVPEYFMPYVRACFGGQTLQQVLEGITFWFTINGVTRACTHEMVRARFAAFMQHGGRDNDWRHRNWTLPETVRRLVSLHDRNPESSWCLEEDFDTYALTIDEENRIQAYLRVQNMDRDAEPTNLENEIRRYLEAGKDLYATLVDAGIPWQDARRFLPIGTQTYIHGIFNYISLRDFLANRMEFVMDWEINCVAQLMYREIKMKCPPLIGAYLGSHSDRAGRAMFAGLESWPPDGKYPVPDDVAGLPRSHSVEQMPFWVLAQSSLDGGPVKWIRTTGRYPHDHPDAPAPRSTRTGRG
ncbi:MAG: FAD-dependent thymidylate synthase [Hyphomicrobiaceae bacterium]|nr:MAG: FAD-dependent thymidylate synthase [Hyphomicrobiaceae bacterium]